jgi:hypothetical protein
MDFFVHFTDFFGHFINFLRAFYGLFFGLFTDFSVDCMMFNKTKNYQQHQDSNRRPYDPGPGTLTIVLLVHMVDYSKNLFQIKYAVLTIKEIYALSVKCRGKFGREKMLRKKPYKNKKNSQSKLSIKLHGKERNI